MVNIGVFKFRCPERPSLFLFSKTLANTNITTKAYFPFTQLSLSVPTRDHPKA